MSYRNQRLMPHPVLSADRNDYRPGCEFVAEIPWSRISDGGRDITITVQYRLKAPTLHDLITQGQARYCTVVECPKTYRRSSHHSNEGGQDLIMLKRPEYDGKLTLTPYVAAIADIPAFKPPELDDELRRLIPAGGTDLPAGAILAIGLPTEIELDNQTAVESIIDLAPDSGLRKGQFAVDLTGQRIAINVHRNIWQDIQQLRNRSDKQPLLRQSLYLYAIEKAIRNLDDGEGKRWADVIRRKLADNGIDDDPELIAENSEIHAQQIFQNPLEGMLTALQQEGGDD